MAGNPERPVPYGPNNPHPLSQLKTELVWEGKYDEFGHRREVDIAGCSMPMQRIETVDEPRQRAAALGQTDMFEEKLLQVRESSPDFGTHTSTFSPWRNRLIWGDNKLVMASLLKEFKGRIDLIYIDPPFDVGADFTMDVPIGDENETVAKDQSTLEMVAFRDMWGKGTDSYLHMMAERLLLMRELLSEKGSIYIHCDWRVNSHLRLVLDEMFSSERFQAVLVWQKLRSVKSQSSHFANMHDTVLVYSKSDRATFNPQFVEKDPKLLETHYRHTDPETGRRYNLDNFTQAGSGPARRFGDKVLPPPPGKHWIWSQDRIDEAMAQEMIVFSSGGVPYVKRFFDGNEGTRVGDIWTDVNPVNQVATERLDYSTQKPEALLERIVQASSNPGDLIADFFCGSGTTGAVAERLSRRWIMADLGRFAIHTSRKRMIVVQREQHDAGKPYRAFDVYNLGRYERQWWQRERLHNADEEHRRIVLEFFKAEVLTNAPSPLIHGRKAGAFCHVDGIDSMFSRQEAKAVASAVAAAGGRECYCLAWEFEMELHLTAAALEKELGVKLKLIQIPREIMEKNRKSPPPFLEVALLEAAPVYRKISPRPLGEGPGVRASVDIKLTKFMPSLAEVPTRELEAIKKRALKSGMDFIDFWAVDFDWQPGKPFNHHWQDFRTRKDRALQTVSDAGHVYPKKGAYTACVKVVDTFGCDTSITVEVRL